MIVLGVVTFSYNQRFNRERDMRAEQHYRQARTLADYGYYEQAVEHYTEALLVERNRFDYRLGLALALYYSQHYQEAQNQLIELRELDPTDATSNLLLARLARRDGRVAEAISSYRTAIYGRWPQNPEQNRLATRFELLDLLEQHGTPGQVVGELLTIMQEEPSNTALAKQVAGIYLEFDAAEEAARVYRDLEEKGVVDAEILAGLGKANFELGNYAQAHSYLERSLRLKDDEEVSRLHTLSDQILALDPTARGLSPSRRYGRSHELLERALGYVDYCLNPQGDDFVGPPAPLPQALSSTVSIAKQRLEEKKPKDYSDAAEANILVAENLWRLRDQACTNIIREDEPLSYVMRVLAQ